MLPVLLKQHQLVDDLAHNSVLLKPGKEQGYYNLLDYITDNIDLDIYTVHTLKIATRFDKVSDVIEVVRFFSGGNSGLFTIKYCYELASKEKINISQEEYNNYIFKGEFPVDENGNDIEDFDSRYLTFYCLLNYHE